MPGLTDSFKQIPAEVKKFVLKGSLLLLGWCLLYGLVLKPYRLADEPLTKLTGQAVFKCAQYLYANQQQNIRYTNQGVLISTNNHSVVLIADACNGLDLYVMFAGFILCVPMGAKKMIKYIVLGITGIFVLNVLRCLALMWLYDHRSVYIDIAHHYVFQLIVYAAIFLIWERYFRSLKVSYEKASPV